MIPVKFFFFFSFSCEKSLLSKIQKVKIPIKNSPSGKQLYDQEYTGFNRVEIKKMEEPNTTGFLRIQSPTENSNTTSFQKKKASNYGNTFDKLFRAASPVVDNSYQHNSTVIYFFFFFL